MKNDAREGRERTHRDGRNNLTFLFEEQASFGDEEQSGTSQRQMSAQTLRGASAHTPRWIGSHSTLNRPMLHVESAYTPRCVGRQNTLNFSSLHFDFGITSVWMGCKASRKASSRPSRREDFSRNFSSFIQRRRRWESFERNKEADRKEKNESEKIFTKLHFCVHFRSLSHFLASCQKLTHTEEKT